MDWLRIGFVVILCCVGRSAAGTADPRDDARLNDVVFVDTQVGWTVGDRGTIWHTTDGGNSWRWQTCFSDGTLESVWFLNRSEGWAAGGESVPYTQRTRGIVLHTMNGGENWEALESDHLPWLIRMRFFDPLHGYAIGQPSTAYPSGVLTTNDGGRSWTPVSGRMSTMPTDGHLWPMRRGWRNGQHWLSIGPYF